jgi:hypothetical protein
MNNKYIGQSRTFSERERESESERESLEEEELIHPVCD